jgi:hypothetical protein
MTSVIGIQATAAFSTLQFDDLNNQSISSHYCAQDLSQSHYVMKISTLGKSQNLP